MGIINEVFEYYMKRHARSPYLTLTNMYALKYALNAMLKT